MAKPQPDKDGHRTQITVAMIAAGAVIIAGVLGLVGSVLSNESDGQDRKEAAITSPSPFQDQRASPSPTATDDAEPVRTMVYVTSVSTTGSGSLKGDKGDYVMWKFAGTVKPPPGGRGVVFVLGNAQDGSQDVNSEPVSIGFDGSWVAVVGPIQRDIAWKMTWTATYGTDEPLIGDPGDRDPPRVAPSKPTGYLPIATTAIPKKMLPPQSP